MASPKVDFVREELEDMLPTYKIIRDCLSGSRAIKEAKTEYLPRPMQDDPSDANYQRYEDYRARAVFYNVTYRTLEGLTGQVYSREPVVDLPSSMLDMIDNADGSGATLKQISEEHLRNVIAYGRSGVWVDYAEPSDEYRAQTELQGKEASDAIRPTIHVFKPWDVINWRFKNIGAKKLLSLVVVQRNYVKSDDGFQEVIDKEYLVLRLNDNDEYEAVVYRNNGGEFYIHSINTPKKQNGKRFREIPFEFASVRKNNNNVDRPPLEDIAHLNIAHYRNSADYEEMVYMLGQPTPFIVGLDRNWVQSVLEGGKIRLGSRIATPLPVGADFKLLEITQTSAHKEAMEQKEQQMIAIGARLIYDTKTKTATEDNNDKSTEESVLSSIAFNVSRSIQNMLRFAGMFKLGDNVENITFDLNTEFDLQDMSPEEMTAVQNVWKAGGLTWEEFRFALRRAGMAFVEDEQAKNDIASELAENPLVTTVDDQFELKNGGNNG